MATGLKREAAPESEAGDWLRRLSRDGETLDHFLAWRTDPARAEAFDKLAAERFGLWAAERELVAARLSLTPESEELERDRLIDRMAELEALILLTRSTDPVAVRAKAEVLLWLMREQDEEQALAMEDIGTFVRKAELGPAAACRPHPVK